MCVFLLERPDRNACAEQEKPHVKKIITVIFLSFTKSHVYGIIKP